MITAAIKTASATKDYFKDRKENYFKGSHGRWQGELGKERFSEKEFKYDDFTKVIDENDRFRTFDLKFSLSGDISSKVTGHEQAKQVVKDSVSKVARQMQKDMKIKFKNETYNKDHFDISISTNKNGELIARMKSHNVAKKNASKIEQSLDNNKYRAMFQQEMVKELKQLGIHSEHDDFALVSFVKEGRVALDVPCHAPKSVSLTMMFEGHRQTIMRCHEKANEAAMRFVEENYIVSRVQVDGLVRRIITHNMLSSRFDDLYNRRLQPHLHTHNLIFNTTRNPLYEPGKKGSKPFLTVDFKTILDNLKVIDRVYKGELINQLRKAGYELAHAKDDRLNFEIKGFSREQLEHFSRKEIDEKLEEMGTDRSHASARVRNMANLMTRPDKVHVDFQRWAEQVRQEMKEMGIESPALVQVKEISAAEKREALLSALDDFLYEHAAFTRQELINGVLERAGDILSAKYVQEYFDLSKRFINLGEKDSKTFFSTRENIEIENRIYQYVEEAKNQRRDMIKESGIKRHLRSSSLNEEQKEAVRFMALCRDRTAGVQGAPGAGKSFMLNEAKNLFEKEGYKVIGLAPSNKSVITLREKAGLYASTIHSFFIQLQKEAGRWENDRNPLDLRLCDFEGLEPGSGKELWLVDEASMIDNHMMNRLLEAAELKQAYLVLIGDANQLQPVGAGRPFTNLLKDNRISSVEVKKILRQKEVWLVFDSEGLSLRQQDKITTQARRANALAVFIDAPPFESIATEKLEKRQLKRGQEITVCRDRSVMEAVKQAVDENILSSLKTLESRIHEVRSSEERIKEIARFYTGLSLKEREQTAIITGTNRDRQKINDHVRDLLRQKGELGYGSVFKVTGTRGKEYVREFAAGDRIIFLKKEEISGHFVMKDDIGMIEKIEFQSRQRLKLKPIGIDKQGFTLMRVQCRGRKIAFDPEDYNHIDHAYCLTTYKEQSASHKRVLANFDTHQYNVNSKNDYLVKLSRSEGEVIIFTDDRKSLYDAIKKEQLKVSVNDFLNENFNTHQPEKSDRKVELLQKLAAAFEYRNAAFTRKGFIQGTMDIYSDMKSLGKTAVGIKNEDLIAYFDERVKNGYFLEMGQLQDEFYFSTEENILIEKEIYEKVQAARNERTGLDESRIREHLEASTLNRGQRQAVLFMTTANERLIAVQGAPGVGKSFMLNEARNIYEDEGYKVVALAPSNKAVLNLKERAHFQNAATIHSYLIGLQKEAQTWDVGRNPLDLRQANLEGLNPGSHKEVWFVDEASLIDNRTMNRLFEAAELKKAKVVLIGDMNQLQPVGAGRPFTNLIKDKRVQYVELKEILRQKQEWTVYHSDNLSSKERKALVNQARSFKNNAALTFVKDKAPAVSRNMLDCGVICIEKYSTSSGSQVIILKDAGLKEAVKDAVNHHIASSLNKLDTRITGIQDKQTRLFNIAQKYAGLSCRERDDTVIITATNKDRIALNDFVRDILKSKKELKSGFDFTVTDISGRRQVREFSPGDKVIFLKKEVIDEHLISKDDVGIIKKIEGTNITISTGGKDIVIPGEKYDHLDHAYARTTYRVQGADYNRVLCNIDTRQSLINSRNDFLVKISRSKHQLEIFTDNKKGLYEAIKNEQFKVSINDFMPGVGFDASPTGESPSRHNLANPASRGDNLLDDETISVNQKQPSGMDMPDKSKEEGIGIALDI